MSSARSQALGLPEIVSAILEQLHCNTWLCAALQVNKLWADEATMLLWRVDPPIQCLIQISNVERRQYYANKITSLEMKGPDESTLQHLQNIRFPRLTHLLIHLCLQRAKEHLYDFLQPTSRSFHYDVWNLPLESLQQLTTRYPDLSVRSLQTLMGPMPLRDLVRILDYMPSLTHIELHSFHWSQNVELYLDFASWPNLQELFVTSPPLTTPSRDGGAKVCS